MNESSATARLAWAAANRRMESPLVNDYKKPFIIRRLIETFFGGLRLFASESVPVYVYILQILIFSMIPIFTTLFVLLEQNGMISLIQAVIINGVLDGLYSLALQLLAHFLRTQKLKSGEIEQVNLATDEEIIEFDSPFGPKTWAFLITEKKAKGAVIIHSLIAGLVGAGVVYYVRPSSTYDFNVPWEVAVTFTILGIFTVSVGIWPLIGGSPPEPATFHPLSWDIPAFSRPSHMLTCVLIHLLSRYHPEMSWLLALDALFHIVFAMCSLLWLFGILPPIDAYFLWLLEQWLVVGLGGSPMSSSLRLVGQAFFGTLTLIMSSALPSFVSLMVFASVRGLILSVDIAWMISSLLPHRVRLLSGFSGKYQETHPVQDKPSLRRTTCQRELALFVPMVITVAALSFGSQLPHSSWYEQAINVSKEENATMPLRPALFQEPAQNAVGICLLTITAVMLFINEIQKVYIMGFLRNPMFLYYKTFQKSNFLYIYSQLLQVGCPLVPLILLQQVVSAEVHLQAAAPKRSFANLVLIIPLTRIFRQIWQFPQASFLQLSVYYVVELIRREANLSLEFWESLSPATRIFLISLAHLWGMRMIRRLTSIMLFMITPFTNKKQHNSISFLLLGFNIGISPILLGLVVLSTVISAPLLPVFTLPIFLLGFPRPLRFWSYPVGRSSNSCDDSVYYEQLTPHVIFALHNLLQCGSLGMTEPGEHFLLRWEDRFMWVQILECGFTYQYYSVKGLELQETSCHTAEASRVDANFSRAFDNDEVAKKGILSSVFNPHAFHTLTPLTHFTVMGYSDTRNVLTGVIDSPDTRSLVRDYFHKAFLYVIMNYILNRSVKTSDLNAEAESRKTLKSASKSASQEHLRKLPKVHKRTEYDFEEGIPRNRTEIDLQGREHRSSVGRRISVSQQSQSQSGRGSRIAWVDDQIQSDPIPIVRTGDTPPPTSIWDDEDNSLNESDEEALNIKNKNEEPPPPPPPPPPLRSRAVDSLSSLDDLTEMDKKVNFIPGLMYDSSDDDDEKITVKKKVTNHKTSAKVNLRMIAQPEIRSPIYESPISAALAPLPSWIVELPFDEEVIDEVQDTFPHAWFKFLLNTFGHLYVETLDEQNSTPSGKTSSTSKNSDSSSGKPAGDKDAYIQRMQYDETLEESYRLLIGTCHLIVLGTDGGAPSTTQVYKTFIGELSWSMALEWLASKHILYELVLKAYRIGVKLALDHTLIGGMTGWAELLSAMEDYTQNWYLGPDARSDTNTYQNSTLSPNAHRRRVLQCIENQWPQSWVDAVRMETSNLFSLGYNAVKGVYTSHLLTLGEAEIAVGRLGSETVRGLWASLVAELLYLTNDDDERYSIQAQPGLLRNLTIQAADPPLGYPIFSSPPLRLAVAWLNATYEEVHASEQERKIH